MRLWKFFLGWLVVAAAGRADQATELAQIHAEVIGGKERIEALTALKAVGYVLTGGTKVKFTLIAARPNRLRLETGPEGHTLVQASNGVDAPWKGDFNLTPPRTAPMAEAEGRIFTADAEFDDPLVAGASRGFTFDYAGEVTSAGKKMVRLLVTRKLTETFAVFVDPETFFITARLDKRKSAGGLPVEVLTRYEDYRPVNGVLLPHRVAVLTDGKPTQVTVIESVEANPKLTPEIFTRPKPAVSPGK
ncbi:MAG: hypothetical protein NTV51_23415 [Verrucomicrobia bacterium]|nr:hypothetical protein [Verrucomicrobiota bacterium]